MNNFWKWLWWFALKRIKRVGGISKEGCFTKRFLLQNWSVECKFVDGNLIDEVYTREELVRMLAAIRKHEKRMGWVVPELI